MQPMGDGTRDGGGANSEFRTVRACCILPTRLPRMRAAIESAMTGDGDVRTRVRRQRYRGRASERGRRQSTRTSVLEGVLGSLITIVPAAKS